MDHRENVTNTLYEQRVIRDALLEAQSRWLEEADREGTTLTGSTIARVIADAFRQEAEKYKTKETRSHDEFAAGGVGHAWEVERGTTPAVPQEGTAG